MVLPGQYLERPTLVTRTADDGSSITLEGLFHRGPSAPAVLVCAPHPRLGGSMDSPVVAELAWAVTRQGHASLRFNYQGVGASQGDIAAKLPDFSGTPHTLAILDSEVGDGAAALKHLADCTTHGKVAIAGYSFGAAVALRLALESPHVSHLLLVAPPTALIRFDAVKGWHKPLFVGLAQDDRWCDRTVLSGLLADRDDVQVELVAQADHTFTRGLTELGRVASTWLSDRSKDGR